MTERLDLGPDGAGRLVLSAEALERLAACYWLLAQIAGQGEEGDDDR
ncbi:MAG: hypothetical protein QXO24_03400 [Candidatus Micrarchaeaceae archaeon]